MGRRAATALHLALVLLGVGLYVVFILPRWWVLTGDIPATSATVGRIVAGLPIGAAAVPVWVILQRSLWPSARTPELALRLLAWSAVLHVVAGTLILLTAITEIWLNLEAAGPWLFGVYGAAGAMVILAVAAFYLSFIAEKPPGPPRPPKAVREPRAKKEKRWGRKRPDKSAGTSTEDADEDLPAAEETTDEADADEPTAAEADGADGAESTEAEPTEAEPTEAEPTEVEADDVEQTPAESVDESEPQPPEAVEAAADAGDATEAPSGLRNRRPAGKTRHRLRR